MTEKWRKISGNCNMKKKLQQESQTWKRGNAKTVLASTVETWKHEKAEYSSKGGIPEQRRNTRAKPGVIPLPSML